MSNKVLFFVDSFTFGGVEQALLRLMEGLDRNLWQPVLIHHSAQTLQPLVEKAGRLEIRRIETPVMPLGISGMKRISTFVKVLREERPAVFHAHLSWPLACKWGVVASILSSVPATILTEQLFLDIPYSGMARLQQRLIASKVGKYITVSRSIAEKMQHTFHIPEHKIRVIHNAVEFTGFASADPPCELIELRKHSKNPVVLTVARLDEQKGHRYLLEAALDVPQAIFAIVGDGPERIALEEQARQLKLEDRVFFFGFQSNIASWLNACDVFVLPSLYEGLPIALLEAMAAGKPVVTTDIPGNREAVIDGSTGCLVPPQDPHALALAIGSLLADPLLGKRIGQAGKETVQQKFSMKEMVRQTAEVYTECLEGKHRIHG